ncbi:hypothetical protein MASR2M15_14110 [Anaerolineales bacterium]
MSNPAKSPLQQILAELRSTDKGQRRTAVIKLGLIGSDEALQQLMFTLENDNEDLIVRSRAALMLGKIGDTRAYGSLVRALNAPGYKTRLNAVEALGKLGDDRAIQPLLHMATHSSDNILIAVYQALDLLGYKGETTAESNPPEEKLPQADF